MFQLVRTYEPIADATGIVYQPRAYGEVQPDGSWDGWLVFFPIPAGTAIPTDRETTQRSFADLVRWSSTVGLVYLEGALERALRIQLEPTLSARFTELALLEGPSPEDAAVLETAAAQAREDAVIAMGDAAVHEAAAAAARAEARERLEDARALERNLEETMAPVTEVAPVMEMTTVTELAPATEDEPVVIREEVRHHVQARRSQVADHPATTGTRKKSKKKKS